MAASQAPVPLDGIDDDVAGGAENLAHVGQGAVAEIAAKSGPRWSMVGMSMARSTRSGTLVGPGICRK